MATSTVTPQLTAEQLREEERKLNEEILNNALKDAVYEGEVSRSGIKDPFSGKDVTKKAKYRLPIARDINEASKFANGEVREVLYWYNYGRKVAARSQIFQALAGLDLGNESTNELWKSFNNAMESMSTPNMSEARLNAIKEFIFTQDKFAPLKEALANYNPDTLEVDFEKVEIRKSTGKKGPRKSGSSESSDSE